MKSINVMLIVILLVFFSGCFESDNNKKGNTDIDQIVNIDYMLDIQQSDETDYMLLIPMINISKVSYHEITDNMKINIGVGTFHINNSSKGISLQIQSNSIHLQIVYSIQTNEDFFLTMKRDIGKIDNYDYYAYMETEISNSINISLDLENDNLFTSGIKYYTSPSTQKLENGWNVIKIKSDAWDI